MRATCVVAMCFVAAAVFAAPLPQTAKLSSGAPAQSVGVRPGGIPNGERQALLDLYTSTKGEAWTNRAKWNTAPGTECSRAGLVCGHGGTTVVRLQLRSNHLVGKLPTSLGNLTNLIELLLDSNEISGSIPPQLGDLTKLEYLNLPGNRLSGSIPTQLGNLTNLTNLWLDSNQLSGPIPTELGNLTDLQVLSLAGNRLSGPIPTQLGSLAGLTFLNLGSNRLSGPIPPELGDITGLQELLLKSNQLVGPVPSSITKLASLFEGQSDFRWNGLYSSDLTVVRSLNAAQEGGDWQSTQTVPVTGLTCGAATATSVALTWTPITYTGDTGGYEVFDATIPGGPYKLSGTTANKSATGWTVTGLKPGTTYYFMVKSVTNPHANNQNTVTSDPSAEVHATTAGKPSHALFVTQNPRVGPSES